MEEERREYEKNGMEYDEDMIAAMVEETSTLYVQRQELYLNSVGGATLAQNFISERNMWQWFRSNYEQGGMFQNLNALKDFVNQAHENVDWLLEEKGKIENLYAHFRAGAGSNQVGMVEEFKSAMRDSAENTMAKANSGQGNMGCNWNSMGGAMVQAGAVGAVVGITVETISSYQTWKSGEITTEEYLMEIAKSGGSSGVTGGIAGGIMVPASAHITLAGVSSLVTIPVAFAVAVGVEAFVAPAFGRGKYKDYLQQAQYYTDLQDCHREFVKAMEDTSSRYLQLLAESAKQQEIFTQKAEKSRELNVKLGALYDSI